ncbi:Clavaminate synthase-like protein [Cyberlindnera jadinii NRRL Y-1542]|uniref:Clavaminate synthase-like protein n=1 Tax=Cyberlindnera jadinii (strain ATCC 18201 / CBS 1600 / BCRC 20928 / JCM 3617 / NBRC 0987 / NRRL Y-1542) TaxID=983966 RepID=A0A1E4S3W8_CYBJN|nr:Clavaminate synthase-like protein [Cyberlindnera jadinii NRRL Y-1542]ODV74218.1 Clavaminate synthase-like protein [Cyberlindnera jadinii NRRL Y-1542]
MPMKKSKVNRNEYKGFHPSGGEVPRINLDSYTSDKFYDDFVKARKPVVIDGVIPEIDLSKFQPDSILDLLGGDELLLVEKKDKGGYGSGTERLKMTFQTFIDTLKSGGDDYYLTTQYAEDDPEEVHRALQHKLELEESEEEEEDEQEDGEVDTDLSKDAFSDAGSFDLNDLHDDFEDDGLAEEFDEDDGEDAGSLVTDKLPGEPLYSTEAECRIQECLQKPLTKLANKIPLQPSIMDRLVPQQINLWVGKYSATSDEYTPDPTSKDYGLGRRIFGGGVSSGLHHDHADNIYIPACGHKRFTIFSPLDADKMYTVGNIQTVYPSGVIDYKNDENAPGWRTLRSDSAIETAVAQWKLDQGLESDKHPLFLQSIEQEENALKDFETKAIDSQGVKKDPPSFSRIPAALVHLDKVEPKELQRQLTKFLEDTWPEFSKAPRLTIDLKPGQMLYLPAGWFHEVTSFGTPESKDFHIALNYWFSPPNDDDNVYTDEYWAQDFQRTRASFEHLLKKNHM